MSDLSYNQKKRNKKINGGFVLIPKSTIRCNQWKELSVYSRCVYIVIMTGFIRDRDMNPEREVKMTHKQIEDISGISHSQVVRSMKELKEKKFLSVKIPGGICGKQNYSVYTMEERYLT